MRAGNDQSLTIDPCRPLRFLYQGVDPRADTTDYLNLPYRLGLLTAAVRNPVSAMCRTKFDARQPGRYRHPLNGLAAAISEPALRHFQ